MKTDDILKIASEEGVLNPTDGQNWRARLVMFAERVASNERSQWESEVSLLRNELERLHELYMFLDKKVFDGSQK